MGKINLNHTNKITRTVCLFSGNPTDQDIKKLEEIANRLAQKGLTIQTKRLCSPSLDGLVEFEKTYKDKGVVLGFGSIKKDNQLSRLLESHDIFFNLDLTGKDVESRDRHLSNRH